jgi:protein phosphatase
MVPDALLAEILLAHGRLRDAGEALIAAANEAGGRDNITVVLLRVEEVAIAAASFTDDPATLTGIPVLPLNGSVEPIAAADDEQGRRVGGGAAPATLEPPLARAAEWEHRVSPRSPRQPSPGAPPRPRRRRRLRRVLAAGAVLAVLALIAAGVYVTAQSVYFIGTNSRGLVTLYSGFPYELPGGLKLYAKDYVSGVSASTLSAQRRRTLLDHSLRSEADAAELVRSLELGELK